MITGIAAACRRRSGSAFAAGVGTLSAARLGYPSPQATNPTQIAISLGDDWQSGDMLVLGYSAVESLTSATVLSHTLTDADADAIAAGTPVSVGIPTLSGATFFQALGAHGGTNSQFLSNKVKWGDTTAATITSSATRSQAELSVMAMALTANETVTWAITGGADQLLFALSGATLTWFGNGTVDYDNPSDSDANNSYVVQVTATDLGGNTTNQTITVSVTQVSKTVTLTPGFGTQSSAVDGTLYNSATGTVGGLGIGVSVPVVCSGSGFTYSKNGGAFTSAAGTVQNGDTLQMKGSTSLGAATGTLTFSTSPHQTSYSFTVDDGKITQWRIIVTNSTASSDRTRIAELQMRATVGGSNLCTGGTPFGDAPEFGNSSYVPASAFDGNAATLYSAGPCPATLGYTFATNTPTVAEIAITASSTTGDDAWAPQAFSLQKNAGGTWTTAQSWTTGAWTLGQTKVFAV